MSVSSVFAVSGTSSSGAKASSQADDSTFDAAMVEALLRGHPEPISSPDGHGGAKTAFRASDAAAMANPGRNWVGATRKADIDVDKATFSISAIAGLDGKLSLEEITAYLQKYDSTGISASDISSGWHKLTGGTDELSVSQLRGAIGNVVDSRSTTIPSIQDRNKLANALTGFKKEASKIVGERAKDQIFKKHNLSEAAYAQLPADRKLSTDHEIADRVQLLLKTDGKKPSQTESAEQAAIAAQAAATAASIEKQQATYPAAQAPEESLRQMSTDAPSPGDAIFKIATGSKS